MNLMNSIINIISIVAALFMILELIIMVASFIVTMQDEKKGD